MDAYHSRSSPGQRECARKSIGDLGRNRGELAARRPPCAAKVCPAKHYGGGDDADPDLACAGESEHEDNVARAAGCAEYAACDDRCGEAGQRRREGREVAQHRRHETACGAPHRESHEKTKRSCGKHPVSVTIATAPIVVPIT